MVLIGSGGPGVRTPGAGRDGVLGRSLGGGRRLAAGSKDDADHAERPMASEGGGVEGRTSGRATGPPVSASILRTSAPMSTGRRKNALPSLESASSRVLHDAVAAADVDEVDGTRAGQLAKARELVEHALGVDVDEHHVGTLRGDARRQHRDRDVDDDVAGAAEGVADALHLGRRIADEDDGRADRERSLRACRPPSLPARPAS